MLEEQGRISAIHGQPRHEVTAAALRLAAAAREPAFTVGGVAGSLPERTIRVRGLASAEDWCVGESVVCKLVAASRRGRRSGQRDL